MGLNQQIAPLGAISPNVSLTPSLPQAPAQSPLQSQPSPPPPQPQVLLQVEGTQGRGEGRTDLSLSFDFSLCLFLSRYPPFLQPAKKLKGREGGRERVREGAVVRMGV